MERNARLGMNITCRDCLAVVGMFRNCLNAPYTCMKFINVMHVSACIYLKIYI
jgi:hypothetical protein